MSLADKHIFAIYIPNFWNTNYKINHIVKIVDTDIVHRLVKVLRTQVGEKFIFFDSMFHGIIEIVNISKKDFSIKIFNFEQNSRSSQNITFLLPLLKKEALEEAVYSLTEIGVSEIQLIVTQKSRQKLLHEKEFIRLESIVIAAAEQSKNYILPKILHPVHISDLKFSENPFKVVFDPNGQSFFNMKNEISHNQEIILIIGPEAGLTEEELQKLEDSSFKKCRLTSTILRAVQATALGAGLFRIV